MQSAASAQAIFVRFYGSKDEILFMAEEARACIRGRSLICIFDKAQAVLPRSCGWNKSSFLRA
jgi:hypothetical protein